MICLPYFSIYTFLILKLKILKEIYYIKLLNISFIHHKIHTTLHQFQNYHAFRLSSFVGDDESLSIFIYFLILNSIYEHFKCHTSYYHRLPPPPQYSVSYNSFSLSKFHSTSYFSSMNRCLHIMFHSWFHLRHLECHTS